MEPIRLFFSKNGEFKKFEPSLSETFAYVVEGEILLKLGRQEYRAKKGESIYYHATEEHQLINLADDVTELILVVTDSYL